MSTVATNAALRPLDDWLPELTRAAVMGLAGDQAVAAADGALDLSVSEPASLGGRLVQANVRDGDEVHVASVGVTESDELACHCECRWTSTAPCPHVVALLFALAGSSRQRDAVLGQMLPKPVPIEDDATLLQRALAALKSRGLDPEA